MIINVMRIGTLSAAISLALTPILSMANELDEQNKSSEDKAIEKIVIKGKYTVNENIDTATGLGLSIRETPQSVTIFTNERIKDQALKAVTKDRIDISYTDYVDNQRKIMQLTPEELIRRYLLHVLPKGVMRIRHFGFLANSCRRKRLAKIREQLGSKAKDIPAAITDTLGHWCCPQCANGRLMFMGLVPLLTMLAREAKLKLSG